MVVQAFKETDCDVKLDMYKVVEETDWQSVGALMCLLFCLAAFLFDSSHRWQNKAAPEDTTPAVVLVMELGARNIAGCKCLKGPSRWISVAWRSTLF